MLYLLMTAFSVTAQTVISAQPEVMFDGESLATYAGMEELPVLEAKYVYAMNLDTGTVVYVKDFSKKTSPANTVKLMTAITAYENIPDIDVEIEASHHAVSTAQGANMAQAVKAISEAEAYDGPSLIIAYAPCINHGIKGGMGNAMAEEKRAVEAGYWHLFRFDPRLAENGENPFQLDSAAPSADYKEFIKSEVRYSSLMRAFPDRAEVLFDKAEKNAAEKYEHLEKLAGK